MGFFDRMSTGWGLGKQSLKVVWNDKTLAVFPLLSGIATLVALAGIYFGIGPEEFAKLMESSEGGGAAEDVNPIAMAMALGGYFVCAFITVFFNVALVGCAQISMEERDSKFMDGIRIAMAHLPSIVLWSIVTASVGLLISAIEREGRAGRVIRSILGAAWAIITYFVIPVMVFEKTNAFSAIGRSTKVMSQTWGENLGARFGLGWLLFLINIPTILLVFGGFVGGPALAAILIPIAVVYGVLTAILGQAAKSVLTVVLYKYATTGKAPGDFDEGVLTQVFQSR